MTRVYVAAILLVVAFGAGYRLGRDQWSYARGWATGREEQRVRDCALVWSRALARQEQAAILWRAYQDGETVSPAGREDYRERAAEARDLAVSLMQGQSVDVTRAAETTGWTPCQD